MADNDINGDSDEMQQEKSQKKTAKYDSGAADLEKVTDYAEEKEISSSDGFSCVSHPQSLSLHVFAFVNNVTSFHLRNTANSNSSSTRGIPYNTVTRGM